MPTDAEDLRIANQALSRLGIGRLTDFADNQEVAQILTAQYTQWVKELVADHPWNFAIHRRVLDQVAAPVLANDLPYLYAIPSDCLRVIEVDSDYPWRVEKAFAYSAASVVINSASPTDASGVATVTTDAVHGLAEDDFTYIEGTDVTSINDKVFQVSLSTSTIYTLNGVDSSLWTTSGSASGATSRAVTRAKYIISDWAGSLQIRYIGDTLMPSLEAPHFKRALSLKIAMDLAEAGVKTTSVLQEIKDEFERNLRRAKTVDGQEMSPEEQPIGTWATEAGRES